MNTNPGHSGFDKGKLDESKHIDFLQLGPWKVGMEVTSFNNSQSVWIKEKDVEIGVNKAIVDFNFGE